MKPEGKNPAYGAVNGLRGRDNHRFADRVWHFGNRHDHIDEASRLFPVLVWGVGEHNEARKSISDKFDVVQARYKNIGRVVDAHFELPPARRGYDFSPPASQGKHSWSDRASYKSQPCYKYTPFVTDHGLRGINHFNRALEITSAAFISNSEYSLCINSDLSATTNDSWRGKI